MIRVGRISDRFSAREAAELAGFKSTHMVDYLCRTGVAPPSIAPSPGRGQRRLYSFRDVVWLRVLNRLLKKRIPVRELRHGLAALRSLDISPRARLQKYLATDGKRLYAIDQGAPLLGALGGRGLTFAFVIDLASARDEVCVAAQRLLPPRRRHETAPATRAPAAKTASPSPRR